MSIDAKLNEVLVIIPARGGSKSVPRKNIIKVMDKPLIAWTIANALECTLVTRVIVSTDDEEIASIARLYGAEVPFMRPIEFAQDSSLDIDFHRHAIDWLLDNEGYMPDMVINLRPTTPSRRPHLIDKAIETFASNPGVDSLRSVHLAQQSPFKMWFVDECGLMQPVSSLLDCAEPYNEPRQNLPLVYWQDGYIDITRPSVILDQNSTTGSLILPFIIDEPALDIDYPDEIPNAEVQLRERSVENNFPVHENTQVRHPS